MVIIQWNWIINGNGAYTLCAYAITQIFVVSHKTTSNNKRYGDINKSDDHATLFFRSKTAQRLAHNSKWYMKDKKKKGKASPEIELRIAETRLFQRKKNQKSKLNESVAKSQILWIVVH